MKMPIMLANPSAESYSCIYSLLLSLKQTLPDSGLACWIHHSYHGRGHFSYRWPLWAALLHVLLPEDAGFSSESCQEALDLIQKIGG